MIQLTWRQFGAQAMVAFGLLAIIAAALAVTGPHLVDLYNTSVAQCKVHNDCSLADTALTRRHLPRGRAIRPRFHHGSRQGLCPRCGAMP
jgi:hypothetical protein